MFWIFKEVSGKVPVFFGILMPLIILTADMYRTNLCQVMRFGSGACDWCSEVFGLNPGLYTLPEVFRFFFASSNKFINISYATIASFHILRTGSSESRCKLVKVVGGSEVMSTSVYTGLNPFNFILKQFLKICLWDVSYVRSYFSFLTFRRLMSTIVDVPHR